MFEQQGVVPHLVVADASAALAFYGKALGATETLRVPAEDGRRLMHAELEINGARVFLRDHFPEFGLGGEGCSRQGPPSELGGTPVTLHLEVENCDAAMARAVAAGATVTMPAEDAFWGARYGQVLDPFGHAWSFAHPLPGAQQG
ncbi:MAG: VOC family protein [Tistlia sp.]|uniref:VOC family protein n=1 Tax=Tistlia sp. TaxID=3057121 RepID=UPI0034A159FF